MRKVLFIIPSLHCSGAARQLTLLAAGLPRDQIEPRLCVLGASSTWVESLRALGVPVDVLGWKRPFDLRSFLALRRLVYSFEPDVLHVWELAALRATALVMGRGGPTLLASAALPPGRLGLIDRWLLQRARRIVAFGQAEADRYHRAGVPAARIAVLPLGVSQAPAVADRGKAPPPSLPEGRILLVIGPVHAHKGVREAVWALDILRYLYHDLHLVVAGEGPERPRVRAFLRAIGASARVHFTGLVEDLTPLLEQAEVVWVPSLREGGRCAALEAMAAGRPVVASRLPGLAEVVVEGETGFLVPPGDKAALARQTRVLLDDAQQRRRFGAAGRQRVVEHFPLARLIEEAVDLYSRERGPA